MPVLSLSAPSTVHSHTDWGRWAGQEGRGGRLRAALHHSQLWATWVESEALASCSPPRAKLGGNDEGPVRGPLTPQDQQMMDTGLCPTSSSHPAWQQGQASETETSLPSPPTHDRQVPECRRPHPLLEPASVALPAPVEEGEQIGKEWALSMKPLYRFTPKPRKPSCTASEDLPDTAAPAPVQTAWSTPMCTGASDRARGPGIGEQSPATRQRRSPATSSGDHPPLCDHGGQVKEVGSRQVAAGEARRGHDSDSQNLSFLFPSPSHTDALKRQEEAARRNRCLLVPYLFTHEHTHTHRAHSDKAPWGPSRPTPKGHPQQAQASSPRAIASLPTHSPEG